jgi:hypothetical protein
MCVRWADLLAPGKKSAGRPADHQPQMTKEKHWIHIESFKRSPLDLDLSRWMATPESNETFLTNDNDEILNNENDGILNNEDDRIDGVENGFVISSVQDAPMPLKLPTLVLPSEVVLLIEVWEPRRPGAIMQRIQVLASQPLTVLRDNILCINDFCILTSHQKGKDQGKHQGTVQGTQVAAQVGISCNEVEGEKLSSSLICIEDSIYSDYRWKDSELCKQIGYRGLDYAVEVDTWARKLGSTVKQKDMHECTFDSLWIKMNTPYCLMHSGDCEHLFLVREVRRWNGDKDPTFVEQYPRTIGKCQTLANQLGPCAGCDSHVISKVVVNSPLVSTVNAKLCKTCFAAFHTIPAQQSEIVDLWLSPKLLPHLPT